MTPEPRQPASEAVARLEASLTGLVEAHEALLEATRRHRAALARADRAALARCVEEETDLLQRIATHETARRAAIAVLVGPGAMLAQVTAALPGERGERITTLGERLRGLLAALAREARVVRWASASLLRHMDGMVQQVARSLDKTGVYGRQGRLASAGTPIRGGLDVML
ncbi:MAG: flagellar export chaperone FlgN [Phycisphaerales bacterium]